VSLVPWPRAVVAESTETPRSLSSANLERNDHQPASRCSTAYSYVKTARNAGPTRHATLEFYTTAFDASDHRQEALCSSPASCRAFHSQAGWKPYEARFVDRITVSTRRIRGSRPAAEPRRGVVRIRKGQDTVCTLNIVGAATNYMYAVMTMTQKVIDLLSGCRPVYTNSLLTELKTQSVVG
jgi:hypothetical protein